MTLFVVVVVDVVALRRLSRSTWRINSASFNFKGAEAARLNDHETGSNITCAETRKAAASVAATNQ